MEFSHHYFYYLHQQLSYDTVIFFFCEEGFWIGCVYMPVGTYKAILCAGPKAFYQNTTWQQIVMCQMSTGIFFKEELKKMMS